MAVNRNYILEKMKGRMMSVDEFNYDMLTAPPLYSLFTYQDIEQLRKFATSIRYSGRPLERLQAIDQIMTSRGFRKFAGGTNRVVYKFLEDDRFVVKVASDAVGIGDNPREFINQNYLKPFVTKCFEVSNCGTIGIFERVTPITSREEFLSIAPFVYDMISSILIGEYVCDDIGSEFFMNYGLRTGFGPVLLDYPYFYKLDGNKLYCNKPDPTQQGGVCGAVIDYDAGFNHLRCTRCGAEYKAIELKQAIESNIIIQKGGRTKMKVGIQYGNEDVVEMNSEKFLDTSPKLIAKKKGNSKPSKVGTLKAVGYSSGRKVVDTVKEQEEKKEAEKPKIVASGTTVNNESKKVPDNAPVKETEVTNQDNNEEKKVQSPLSELQYVMFAAEVGNTAEIDGDEDQKMKVLILKDINSGKPVRFDLGNTGRPLPIVIPNIGGVLLSELCIIKKEAQITMETKIEDLEAANAELVNDYNKLVEEFNELQNKYTELQQENENLTAEINGDDEEVPEVDDGLPYFIDSKGRKRDKRTKRFWKEPEIDTSSPLIPEKKNDNDEDDTETDPAEEKVEEIPVGAAPPTTKNSSKGTSKRSERYNPDFYNQGNTSGKGNKRK